MANRYALQQVDIDILRQDSKDITIRIDILNSDDKVIQSIEGVCMSAPFSIDACSDIRRTLNLNIHVISSTYTISEDSMFWFKRKIKPYYGIYYIRTRETVYYPLGEFYVTDGSFTYSATDNSLTVNCSDKMCMLNGDMGGKIGFNTLTVLAGEDMRSTIIAILNDAGISRYLIEDLDRTIPYDKEYSGEFTYCQVIRELLDLYSECEMFFDVDGVFRIRKIPYGVNERNVLDDDILMPLLISESKTTDLKSIYNHIIVYGQCIEPDYFADSCTVSGSVYKAQLTGFNGYTNFAIYAVTVPSDNVGDDSLSINGFSAKVIRYDDGVNVTAGYITSGTWCFKYRAASDDFLLLGQYEVHSEVKCEDDNTPFSINKIGDKVIKLSGGDYDKIYSNSLAEQRAKYELYNRTCLQQTISMETILIPWLDVNYKFSHATKYEDTCEYLIQSVSGNLAEPTMNIQANRYYPTYASTLI